MSNQSWANTVVSLKEKEKYVSPQYDLTSICSLVAVNITTWYVFHQIPKNLSWRHIGKIFLEIIICIVNIREQHEFM